MKVWGPASIVSERFQRSLVRRPPTRRNAVAGMILTTALLGAIANSAFRGHQATDLRSSHVAIKAAAPCISSAVARGSSRVVTPPPASHRSPLRRHPSWIMGAAKASSYVKDLKDVEKDEVAGSGPRTYYRTLYRLNMRSDEDVNSPLIGILPVGAKISVREINGRRARLETSTEGVDGWISLATSDGDLNVKYISGPDGSQSLLDALKMQLEQETAQERAMVLSAKKTSESMPLSLQILLPFLAIASAYVMVSIVTGGLVTSLFPKIFKNDGGPMLADIGGAFPPQ
mmetsp:Transcript_13153/g.18350  ORF Transcript_13153/g.18350 Transcript_13153/m.18350 type:complete len:287 (+) Transcript_13153:245-1105(+)